MRHYFLTGATGVVGSAFLSKIAIRQERATLLLRADAPSGADERLRRLLAFLEIQSPAAQKIDAVCGDLSRSRLGLEAKHYKRLADSCTHMVHCAGNVHMNLPLTAARRQTLSMTHGMLDLLEASSKVRKMEFVSTVGVAGHTAGEIPEAWIEHPRAFRNSYEAAKAEAEEIVREKIDAGLPITVHRPSMVVGDSHTGRTVSFQVFYYLCEFLSGARSKGFIPQVGDMRLDIIPADFVAAVLDWSSQKEHLSIPILHACSGREGALVLKDMIPHVRSVFKAHHRKLPSVRMLPVPVFQCALRLATPLLSPRDRRALKALPFFLAYLKEDQSFGNSQARRLLKSDGIEWPKTENYLGKVLHYYLSAGKHRRLKI